MSAVDNDPLHAPLQPITNIDSPLPSKPESANASDYSTKENQNLSSADTPLAAESDPTSLSEAKKLTSEELYSAILEGFGGAMKSVDKTEDAIDEDASNPEARVEEGATLHLKDATVDSGTTVVSTASDATTILDSNDVDDTPKGEDASSTMPDVTQATTAEEADTDTASAAVESHDTATDPGFSAEGSAPAAVMSTNEVIDSEPALVGSVARDDPVISTVVEAEAPSAEQETTSDELNEPTQKHGPGETSVIPDITSVEVGGEQVASATGEVKGADREKTEEEVEEKSPAEAEQSLAIEEKVVESEANEEIEMGEPRVSVQVEEIDNREDKASAEAPIVHPKSTDEVSINFEVVNPSPAVVDDRQMEEASNTEDIPDVSTAMGNATNAEPDPLTPNGTGNEELMRSSATTPKPEMEDDGPATTVATEANDLEAPGVDVPKEEQASSGSQEVDEDSAPVQVEASAPATEDSSAEVPMVEALGTDEHKPEIQESSFETVSATAEEEAIEETPVTKALGAEVPVEGQAVEISEPLATQDIPNVEESSIRENPSTAEEQAAHDEAPASEGEGSSGEGAPIASADQPLVTAGAESTSGAPPVGESIANAEDEVNEVPFEGKSTEESVVAEELGAREVVAPECGAEGEVILEDTATAEEPTVVESVTEVQDAKDEVTDEVKENEVEEGKLAIDELVSIDMSAAPESQGLPAEDGDLAAEDGDLAAEEVPPTEGGSSMEEVSPAAVDHAVDEVIVDNEMSKADPAIEEKPSSEHLVLDNSTEDILADSAVDDTSSTGTIEATAMPLVEEQAEETFVEPEAVIEEQLTVEEHTSEAAPVAPAEGVTTELSDVAEKPIETSPDIENVADVSAIEQEPAEEPFAVEEASAEISSTEFDTSATKEPASPVVIEVSQQEPATQALVAEEESIAQQVLDVAEEPVVHQVSDTESRAMGDISVSEDIFVFQEADEEQPVVEDEPAKAGPVVDEEPVAEEASEEATAEKVTEGSVAGEQPLAAAADEKPNVEESFVVEGETSEADTTTETIIVAEHPVEKKEDATIAVEEIEVTQQPSAEESIVPEKIALDIPAAVENGAHTERPRSPWTPSFQVTTIGQETALSAEEDIPTESLDHTEDIAKDVPSIHPTIVVEDKSAEIAANGTEPSADTTEASGGNSLPWTPSYSVHSQGSPSPTHASLEPEASAEVKGDVTQENVVVTGEEVQQEEAAVPITQADNESLIPVEQSGSGHQPVEFQAVETSEPAHEPVSLEAEVLATSAIAEPKTPIEVQTQTPAEASAPSESIPSTYADLAKVSLAEESSLLTPSSEQVRSASPSWVPSYSVSNQGSPLLNHASLPPVAADVTEQVAAPVPEIPQAEIKQETPEDNVVPADSAAIMDDATADNDKAQAGGESQSGLWTPSYSVTRQGPESLEEGNEPPRSITQQNDTKEAEPEAQPIPAENKESAAFSTIGLIGAGVAGGAATALAASAILSMSKNTDDKGDAGVNKKDASPSNGDAAPELKASKDKVFPTVEIPVEDHTKTNLSALPPLDENNTLDTTSPLLTSPVSSRKRLESTTSSRLFPGGWFSNTSQIPNERASLEIAQGVFTGINRQRSPSESTPISPEVDPVTPVREQSSSDKRKWCIIM